MKIARIVILVIIFGVLALNVFNIVSDVIFWTVMFGVLLLIIFDYYWLGGKLNREGRHYGKK